MTYEMFEVIGEIDDGLIDRCLKEKKAPRRKKTLIWIAAAACLCIAVLSAVVYGLIQGDVSSGDDPSSYLYRLPPTGGDSNSWFYEKFNLKSSTISGEWFDELGETVSDWCEKYDREKKSGRLDTTYPPLVKFIKECNITKETCVKVMEQMRINEEMTGLNPPIHLTEEEINVIYSGDIKQINKTFVSEYSIYANGKIFTPEWLVNHTAKDYRREGITYGQLKEKVDKYYTRLLEGTEEKDEFLSVFQNILQELSGKTDRIIKGGAFTPPLSL